ncbi:MAG: hypothetical protein KGK30_00670, partial [Elusimicrobia bacterium]|nr:hypothetical protein [Elusimicrobiota bacterium]
MSRAAAFLSVLLLSAPAAAQVFTPAQVKFMLDKDKGAEAKTQRFYHFFKKNRDPSLQAPAWIDQTLDAMIRRPVWRDPEEGILNEAQLWQAPVSVLYEFFEITRKTLLPSDGGQLESPAALISDYEDNRVRFQMSLDRLYRARLDSSLGGRGRAVMADFNLIAKEMDSVLDGLTNGDVKRYRSSVLAIAALSNGAYSALWEQPRGYAPPPSPNAKSSLVVAYLLKLLGIFAMFCAGWFLATLNEKKIDELIERYKAKAKDWAHEYERQFLTIKVNYLVGAPIALGLLLGILSFDPFGFLIFTGFGVY